MVDIEDRMNTWRFRSTRARELGRRVRELCIEINDIASEHESISNEAVGGHLEGANILVLAGEARDIRAQAQRLREELTRKDAGMTRGRTLAGHAGRAPAGPYAFDIVGLRQFELEVESAETYLRWAGDPVGFFGHRRERNPTPKQVASLVDALFLPGYHGRTVPAAVKLWRRTKEKEQYRTQLDRFPRHMSGKPSVRGMAHQASLAKYHRVGPEELRERHTLLRHYQDWADVTHPEMLEQVYDTTLRRLLRGTLDAFVSFGMLPKEDRDAVLLLNREIEHMGNDMAFARLQNRETDFLREDMPPHYHAFLDRGKDARFRIGVNWADGLWSYADGRTKQIDLRADMLLVSQDRDTGAYIVYAGDAYWTLVHEITHQRNWHFSRVMPAGLDNDPRAMSWAGFPHLEGVTTWSEDAVALEWLTKHYRSMGMSKDDLKAAQLKQPERERWFRTRLFYWTHAASDPETAAEKTYEDTLNPAHRLTANHPQEKLYDRLGDHSYDLGGPELDALFAELREHEARRLGSRGDPNYAAADDFISAHKALIVQGTLMGNWALKQLRPWFFDQYIARLEETVGARRFGRSQVGGSWQYARFAASPE